MADLTAIARGRSWHPSSHRGVVRNPYLLLGMIRVTRVALKREHFSSSGHLKWHSWSTVLLAVEN